MLSYTPTPAEDFHSLELDKMGIQLLIKREDLNHPLVSGNKWWKLKYNLEEAARSGKETILTFGGAYSNHIYATAAAAKETGMKSIGVIRGERVSPLNPTLRFAARQNMNLHFISRKDYNRKNETDFIAGLKAHFGDFYLIPEGGTNSLAVQGCSEFAVRELNKLTFSHLMLPVGTGGTMAGIIHGLEGKREIIGVSVLKNGAFLVNDISAMLKKFSLRDYGNWRLVTSYDHGGYAKVTGDLLRFIVMMEASHNLPLDPVYTGKLMWAAMREAEQRAFPRGSVVLVLHTGGLQGSETILTKHKDY